MLPRGLIISIRDTVQKLEKSYVSVRYAAWYNKKLEKSYGILYIYAVWIWTVLYRSHGPSGRYDFNGRGP